GEAIRAHKGRSADLRADGRLAVEREQFAVAPHVPRAGLELRAADVRLDLLVVVGDFERPGVVWAEEVRGLRVDFAAHATLQTQNEVVTRHRNTPVGMNGPRLWRGGRVVYGVS